jgi:hypothetical protein
MESRRDFLKATVVAGLALPGLPALAEPKKVRLEEFHSGCTWNGWGFYKVATMKIVDNVCGDDVPGTNRFEIWYDPEKRYPDWTLTSPRRLLFRLGLADGERYRTSETVGCLLPDDWDITPRQLEDVRNVATAIYQYLKREGRVEETRGFVLGDTRLGRVLNAMLCLEDRERLSPVADAIACGLVGLPAARRARELNGLPPGLRCLVRSRLCAMRK